MPEENGETAEAGEQNEQTETSNLPATQEELDRVIQKRLDRERARFSDYDQLKDQAQKVEGLQGELDAANQKLAEHAEREQHASLVSDVSKETGVPGDVLRGSTRDELVEHAEALKALTAHSQRVVIPNAGDAPEKKTSPESDFVGNLFGQGN